MARPRRERARDEPEGERVTFACLCGDVLDLDGNYSSLPNGIFIVSCCIGASVDSVSCRRNQFFILPSLSSLILLPYQQNSELCVAWVATGLSFMLIELNILESPVMC